MLDESQKKDREVLQFETGNLFFLSIYFASLLNLFFKISINISLAVLEVKCA